MQKLAVAAVPSLQAPYLALLALPLLLTPIARMLAIGMSVAVAIAANAVAGLIVATAAMTTLAISTSITANHIADIGNRIVSPAQRNKIRVLGLFVFA
jgi:hypothetical protein